MYQVTLTNDQLNELNFYIRCTTRIRTANLETCRKAGTTDKVRWMEQTESHLQGVLAALNQAEEVEDKNGEND